MLNHLKHHFGSRRTGGHGGLDIARHIGPGLLVTVGFIDPGNWASNMAAGSQFGYALLWVVTLSTIMLIVLQHNAAHLGIATGACLAEATTRYLPRFVGRTVLASAYLATIATAMAEVLGGAIALQMLFGLPVRAGCVIVAAGFRHCKCAYESDSVLIGPVSRIDPVPCDRRADGVVSVAGCVDCCDCVDCATGVDASYGRVASRACAILEA